MNTPINEMILERTDFTDKTTIGDLYLDSQWFCFLLEPTCRILPGIKRAIPQGKYEMVIYNSPHFGRKVPLLLKVPGHNFVEIHPGNHLADTHDCLLPGKIKDVDWVGNSEDAFDILLVNIEAKLKLGPFYLGIIGGNGKTTNRKNDEA